MHIPVILCGEGEKEKWMTRVKSRHVQSSYLWIVKLQMILILFIIFFCVLHNVCVCVCVCVCGHSVIFYSLRLLGLTGSSVHGIFQPRILEWVAISSSRGSSWPRDLNLHLLWLLHCRWILCCWATRWVMKMRSWQAEKQAVVCTDSNAQTM